MGRIMLLAVFTISCLYISIPAIGANEACLLPAVSGMCKAYIPSYFYNSTAMECQKFIYGGCGGNDNRFTTLEQCQHACDYPNICQSPKVVGPCDALMPMWYFDIATCRCKRFNYGGCSGNQNRFPTKAKCKDFCGNHPCTGCKDPLKVGPCRAAIPRWFYNETSNSCQEFSWGGCQPNGNNFVDEQECETTCRYVCTLPRFDGPEVSSVRRFFYKASSNRCVRFRWGGEEANGNNFPTRRRCKRICKRK